MSNADREKWDERYREGAYADREHPSALLAEWEPELPRGRALDVACGAGRNSLFLAGTGREVHGVDISAVGLDRAREAARGRGLEVHWTEADLENRPEAGLPAGPFDLIVLIRYVSLPLLPLLIERLRGGGCLLCEQHVVTSRDVVGPKNPAYRLDRNQLLRAVTALSRLDLRVLYYREGAVTDPDGRPAALAQLVLRRGTDCEQRRS